MDQSFTPTSQIGEFGLINRMQRQLGPTTSGDVIAGIGDDAAVYRISEDRCHVVTTDALIEGVHFDRSFVPMRHLGRKSIAVNVSDILAMNAIPRYAVVTLGMPRNLSVEMVEDLYAGIAEAAEQYGLVIVGGDTTAAPQLVLNVTAIGEAHLEQIVFRSGARPGDLICISGHVGGAFAGLQVLLDQRREMQELGVQYEPNIEPYRNVINRQLSPTARLDAVMSWRSVGIRPRALIDVSDGVASEIHHICAASGCGAIISAGAIPIDAETQAAAAERVADVDTYALFGGEDYELLFALDPADADRLDENLFTIIGQFTLAEEGVVVETEDGSTVPLSASGYDHFDPGGDGADGSLDPS